MFLVARIVANPGGRVECSLLAEPSLPQHPGLVLNAHCAPFIAKHDNLLRMLIAVLRNVSAFSLPHPTYRPLAS